jgi:hypothetical protein
MKKTNPSEGRISSAAPFVDGATVEVALWVGDGAALPHCGCPSTYSVQTGDAVLELNVVGPATLDGGGVLLVPPHWIWPSTYCVQIGTLLLELGVVGPATLEGGGVETLLVPPHWI